MEIFYCENRKTQIVYNNSNNNFKYLCVYIIIFFKQVRVCVKNIKLQQFVITKSRIPEVLE